MIASNVFEISSSAGPSSVTALEPTFRKAYLFNTYAVIAAAKAVITAMIEPPVHTSCAFYFPRT